MGTRLRLVGALSAMLIGPMLMVVNTPSVESRDPGIRGGPPAAGGPLSGLTPGQLLAFHDGEEDFKTSHSVDGSVAGAPAIGLGPRFNLEACSGCHKAPGLGGSSPARNPQIDSAVAAGASNTIPSFLSLDGPVRVVRFIAHSDGSPDGSVHALFTIAGRHDAPGCQMKQPDFDAEARRGNLVFRIPTPAYGGGLVENIADETLLANKAAFADEKAALGIHGRENRNGQDNTITRFGWKAQNVSLMNFAGEAYNVEMGVTNEVFPNERTPECAMTPTPEDHPDFAGTVSGVQHFSDFMRMLAPPTPAPDTASTVRGRQLFSTIGCALCHTPSMPTHASEIVALSTQTVLLYSDLLLHNMGRGLGDHLSQGLASGEDFRTAPLWGTGQRRFFLHDGRTADLKAAILAHESRESEANAVVGSFKSLQPREQQDVLNFLRGL